jgi:hypothetical protein
MTLNAWVGPRIFEGGQLTPLNLIFSFKHRYMYIKNWNFFRNWLPLKKIKGGGQYY